MSTVELEAKLNLMVAAAMEVIHAAQSIKPEGIPENELFATFKRAGFTVRTFYGLLAVLERRKLITRHKQHVMLFALPPAVPVETTDPFRKG